MNKFVGLGPIGPDFKLPSHITDIMLSKKKFRFTFEGKDKDGNISFPVSFVKIDKIPYCSVMAIADENGGKIVSTPGDLIISSHFEYRNSHLEYKKEQEDIATKEFDRINDTAYNTISGVLKCSNEEWKLEGIKLTSSFPFPEADYDDGIMVDWHMSYEKCDYNNKWEKGEFDIPIPEVPEMPEFLIKPFEEINGDLDLPPLIIEMKED